MTLMQKRFASADGGIRDPRCNSSLLFDVLDDEKEAWLLLMEWWRDTLMHSAMTQRLPGHRYVRAEMSTVLYHDNIVFMLIIESSFPVPSLYILSLGAIDSVTKPLAVRQSREKSTGK